MDTAIYTVLISLFGGGMLASLLFVARVLNARLGDMSIRLGEMDSRMGSMEGQIHRLSDKIDANRVELSEKIEANRVELSSKIEANGREISKLVIRTAVIETRLGSIETHLRLSRTRPASRRPRTSLRIKLNPQPLTPLTTIPQQSASGNPERPGATEEVKLSLRDGWHHIEQPSNPAGATPGQPTETMKPTGLHYGLTVCPQAAHGNG